MLSEVLKTNTQQPHQELEKIIVYKIKQLDSKAAYVNFLKVFYGYIAAVEQRISSIAQKGIIADEPDRRKASKLLDDILALEPHPGSVPFAADLPQINSVEQAFGAMYVLEGSTLGGKYISRMITQKLNLTEEKGLSFFNGYKEDTMIMWERFKEMLNKQVINPSSQDDITEAANQTFIKFKKWINEH